MAETRESFSLVLTSATGGATISEEYGKSHIVYVASDHPYGLFEFQSASEMLVNEESEKASQNSSNIIIPFCEHWMSLTVKLCVSFSDQNLKILLYYPESG